MQRATVAPEIRSVTMGALRSLAMPTIEVNAAALYYEERGSGPPLLLVHGTGAYADLWSPILDGLARSYRVIAYDRRGFARSSSAPRGKLADHARDAAALLTALDASPATVVGWSAGGVVALDLAASYPERVASLVLAEPAVHLSTHPRRGTLAMSARSNFQRYVRRDQAAAAAAMYRWAGGYTTGGNAFDGFPDAWREQMLANAPTTLREMDQMIRPYPSRAAIRSITCPVTVIEGELSDPAFPSADAFLMRLLPQARMVSLPGAAHMLHIDKPDLWVDAVPKPVVDAGAPVPA
jgi:pimeloyl-ACP methyl ester carboxylesterase